MIREVIDWYGSQAQMARKLGVDRAAVAQWVSAGKFPPARAIQIEEQSGGLFKAVDLPRA